MLNSLRLAVARIFRREQLAEEMEEEQRMHIALRADDLERRGQSRAEAERRARVEFGARERYKEESYRAMGGNLVHTLAIDVRFALRVLRKSPGFAAAAVFTLALAIGANAIVFALLNAFILRPLKVPEPQSLWGIEDAKDHMGYQSYPDYLDMRTRNRSFDDLAAFTIAPVGLDTGKEPSQAWVNEVSGNYFDALGIQPFLGRVIHASDERGPNSAPYIVLAYSYWHSHFQDDRTVLGRVVRLNKHPFTIVGVAPPGFAGTLLFFSPDFFTPVVNQQQVEGENRLDARGDRLLMTVMGHLKPGVTPAGSAADLRSIDAYLEKTYPKDHPHMELILARPSLGGDWVGGPIKAFLTGLMLLAGLILLAACANLGSLFGARAADRSREVALRLALGSSRTRILRQLFTEAVVISLSGGVLGLWGSMVLLRWLSAWRPFPQFPMNIPVNPDAKVYLVALLLALASGFLFGAVPVRQVLSTNPYQIAKGSTSGRAGRRFSIRDCLLCVQIAICAVLVTSSMVAVRGLVRSLHSHFGFEPRNALLVDTDLGMAGYSPDKMPAMQTRMIDAMKRIPRVTDVGLVSSPPMHMGWEPMNVFTDQTADLRPSNAAASAIAFRISPDYFAASGTPLLWGRTFAGSDDNGAPHVAVINREFARRIFGSAAGAAGKHFKVKEGFRVEVVGMVEDGKYTANLNEDPQPAVFLPILQWPVSETWMVVRSSRDRQEVAEAIRRTMRGLDAGLPVFIQTWNEEMNGALFASRMASVSLGVLGIMGAMLSITGIFGMAAYSVSKRLKELGIRVALGAGRTEVLKTALGRAVRLLAIGSAAGLALGLLATKVLAFIVYEATPRDPLVLAGVVLAMALLGLVATWIPAQRALGVNPMTLLREE